MQRQRFRLAIIPAGEQRIVDTAGQQGWFSGGTEDDACTGRGGAGDLRPELVELGVGHPVLGVEQDEAVDRCSRLWRRASQ